MSVRRVVQLSDRLPLRAKALSQYVRFHKVALQVRFDEAHSMLIAAANTDVNSLLDDETSLGTNAQRRSREQPAVVDVMPEVPGVKFTRLCLLIGDSKGLTVVKRMEKCGAASKASKGEWRNNSQNEDDGWWMRRGCKTSQSG